MNSFRQLSRSPFPPVLKKSRSPCRLADESKAVGLQGLRRLHREAQLAKGSYQPISPDQACSLILESNKDHVSTIARFARIGSLGHLSPMKKWEHIKSGEADKLIIRCFDSRIVSITRESEIDTFVFVYSPGAMIPAKDSTSNGSVDTIRTAISRILDGEKLEYGTKPGGLLVVLSHSDCHFFHHSEEDVAQKSAIDQVEILRSYGIGARGVVAIHYDLGSKTGFSIISEEYISGIELMADSSSRNSGIWRETNVLTPHLGAADTLRLDMQLSHERARNSSRNTELPLIDAQMPHSVVVCDLELPFDISIIAGSQQNELFPVTGSRKGLSETTTNAIKYAIQELNQEHIVFVLPSDGTNTKEIKETIELWKQNLRDAGSFVLRSAQDRDRDISIRPVIYDVRDGRLVEANEFFSEQ